MKKALRFLSALVALGVSAHAENTEMEYVNVCGQGCDCKKFSRLIMGTDHLVQSSWTEEGQVETSDQQLYEILDEAAKLGINLFDTAPIYVGGIENKLGKWMQSRGHKIKKNDFYYDSKFNPDRELYTLSKGGFPFDLYSSQNLETGSHSTELKTTLRCQGYLGDFEDSGQALRLTHVPPGTYTSRLFGGQNQVAERVAEELSHSTDNLNGKVTIYLMHRDDGDYLKFKEIPRQKTSVKTIMEALSDPELSSKYWGLGWSNWGTERVNDSIKVAEENGGLSKPLLNSPYFSLFEMSERSIHAGGVQVTHDEMMNPDFQKGIKLNPYSPLGGFSILDRPVPKWENAKRAAKQKYDQGDAYWQNVFPSIFTDANKARYDRVLAFTQDFNKRHGADYTIDQMVNAYALAHPRVDFLTVGPINVEQLRRTVKALKLSRMLNREDLEYLYRSR